MRLVMTLLARDEADIVDAQIAFHLDAGVDFVVATDNRSEDETTAVLERYERNGVLHLIREAGDDLRQTEWVSRMAQVAATEFGADWVLNTDADEFWWCPGPGLRPVLEAVPARFGVVRGAWRNFVPRPDAHPFFAERMIVRLAAPSFHPHPLTTHYKSAHRATADVRVGRGNHEAFGSGLVPLRGMVSDRDPPLPGSLVGALPAQVRDSVRRTREERREGHRGPHGRRISRLSRR
jgi:hypothetical protein